MSEHHAVVCWERDAQQHETYKLQFENGVQFLASSNPDASQNDFLDPEQAFVASISNCHMLSFLAIAAKRGVKISKYVDHAVGLLSKNEEGRIAITKVVLRPEITFDMQEIPTTDEIQRLHEMTSRNCFIANSVRTKIEVQPN